MAGDGRWVCLRCFTSNEPTAATCANCGLARGGDPAAASGASGEAWTAPALPPAESGRRRIPWNLVLYGVIGLVVVGSTLFFAARRSDEGEITDAGDLSVQDLRVGDCFELSGDLTTVDQAEVGSVRAIPCEEPHVYEVYVVSEYPANETPSAIDEPYSDWELAQCLDGFEAYVGIDFDSSRWYFSTLTPTDESWDQGDRAIQCFLHNENETSVTGSAQGTAQ
jgi:hypothetical protein